MHSSALRARLSGLIILAAAFLLDQWSKSAVAQAADAGGLPHEIFPFFSLVLVHNHGISFGFFAQGQHWMPLLITAITSAVAAGLLIWLLRAGEAPMTLALGSIIGGALGNITDRVRLGAVTDFLDFHMGAHHWPAFNFADSAIFIGVVILVLISIVGPFNEKENAT